MEDEYLTMEQRDIILATLVNAEQLLKQVSVTPLKSPLMIILEEQLKESEEILMNVKVG